MQTVTKRLGVRALTMTTTYRIVHNGRVWTTDNREIAQEMQQRGAKVTATTSTDHPGIALTTLSDERLQSLESVAQANGWGEVIQSVREARQLQIEQ